MSLLVRSQLDHKHSEPEHQGIPGLFDLLPDGTVLRSEFITLSVAPTHTLHSPSSAASRAGCLSRDVVLDAHTGLQVRLFLPESALTSPSLLPVIVYVHGGGFCMCSAKTLFVHNFCMKMATVAGALVVSVEYRLAPEHRLPAAYDDGDKVLGWLASQYVGSEPVATFASYKFSGEDDPWISSYADLSSTFLMGEGSGANILHHVWLRRRAGSEKLLPIKGVISVHPLFGGEERTPSEIRFEKDDFITPADLLDEFWRFSLPVGASRNHPFCNPFSEEVADLSEVEFPRTLVVVGGRNSLFDRQVEYFKLLKKFNKDVQLLFLKNAQHAFEFLPGENDEAGILLQCIVRFLSEAEL